MGLDYTRKLHSNFGTIRGRSQRTSPLFLRTPPPPPHGGRPLWTAPKYSISKNHQRCQFLFSKTLPLINYLWVLFQAEQQPQIWIPSCITSENEQEIVFFLYFFPEPQNTARFLSCKAKWVLLKTKMYAIFFHKWM